jgi:hypothetical protein
MTRKPPAWILAAADQDYAGALESLDQTVNGARLLIHDWPEVEAWAEVWLALSRIPPHAALAMGAAAIVQLAKQQPST